MVGVRAILAQVPLALAPAAVRRTARTTIARRPAPLPPPIEPGADAAGSAAPGQSRIRFVPLGLAGVAFAIAATAAVVLLTRGSGPDKVAALTKVAAKTSLAVDPGQVRPDGAFELRNTSTHAVAWSAHGSERWLSAQPTTGVLAPGESTRVTVVVASDAPGGRVNVALDLTGDDGSATAIPVSGSVEHAPTLAAKIDGCTVRARAEDEDGVASVTLHWADPTERAASMQASPADGSGAYVGSLPPSPRPIRWSVSATDGRGNLARTPDREIAPGTC
jgi:hypothetical protein